MPLGFYRLWVLVGYPSVLVFEFFFCSSLCLCLFAASSLLTCLVWCQCNCQLFVLCFILIAGFLWSHILILLLVLLSSLPLLFALARSVYVCCQYVCYVLLFFCEMTLCSSFVLCVHLMFLWFCYISVSDLRCTTINAQLLYDSEPPVSSIQFLFTSASSQNLSFFLEL